MTTAAEKAAARKAKRAAMEATTEPAALPEPATASTQPTPADPNAIRRALTPPQTRQRAFPRRITLDLTEDQDDRLAALAHQLRPVGKAAILRALLNHTTDDEIRAVFHGRTWTT